MNRNTIAKISRKIKFGINIPLKVFKRPNSRDSVTSDLFPIRNDENWSTEFEFLNLPGLIRGDISSKHKANLVFFNKAGVELGRRDIEISGLGRRTISLSDFIKDDLEESSTFCVFHERSGTKVDLGGSFMAERGYAGYKFRDEPVKGYVHGNLDAVSYSSGVLQKLGNFGFTRKTYFVQHLLTGPAEYNFVITNPTSKKITIKPIIEINGTVKVLSKQAVQSLGCHIFKANIQHSEVGQIRFKSYLYLGRPVVFRIANNTFDVFHG
jgi:hypothetical protein